MTTVKALILLMKLNRVYAQRMAMESAMAPHGPRWLSGSAGHASGPSTAWKFGAHDVWMQSSISLIRKGA